MIVRNVFSGVERRFEALTGLDPRRKGGELYADRLLVYEECVGGASPLSLGLDAQRELYAQLATILNELERGDGSTANIRASNRNSRVER